MFALMLRRECTTNLYSVQKAIIKSQDAATFHSDCSDTFLIDNYKLYDGCCSCYDGETEDG